jgi:hypothetical protein
MDMREKIVSIWFVFPIFAGLYAAYDLSVLTLIITVILIYGSVGAVPFCSKHESLWVYLMAAISMTPINVKFVYSYSNLLMFGRRGIITYILSFILYCMFLLSVEEIVFGLCARVLWKKQYRILS